MPVSPAILALRRAPVLRRIAAAASATGQRVWLTGGFLRDRLGGFRAKAELDLTVRDPASLLGALRLEGGESLFVMDVPRQTWRMVIRPPAAFTCIDVTRFRAPAIEEDLGLRDFTVNALAFDLTPRAPARILDPTGGIEDLRRRRLRPCSKESFRDDPLRALRALRFASTLGFRLPPATVALMGRSARGLAEVSGERIREELFQILQGPDPAGGGALLLRLGLLRTVDRSFRATPRPSLPLLRRLSALLRELPPRSLLAGLLDEGLEQGVRRRGIAALAALLLDAGGGPRAPAAARRLVLGGRASAALAGLANPAGDPLPPEWLGRGGGAGRREMLRLFRACDGFAAEAVALGAARSAPGGGAEEARRFMGRYARARRLFLRPPLLGGRQALELLGIPPGPALGSLLRKAKEAQDLGAFGDLEGALRWAEALLPLPD